MRKVVVEALKNQVLIADKCLVAESFFDRLKGWIGRSQPQSGEGLLFPRCNNIHMWFMRFPIDVVFIRGKRNSGEKTFYEVSSVRENIRPWKPFPLMDWKASETLELPAGSIRRSAIGAGDEICIVSR